MKKFIITLLVPAAFFACKDHEAPLVGRPLIDSLFTHYTPPAMVEQNLQEGTFWRDRIDPARPGYLNESRYAGCLSLDFRLTGQIDSLLKADSILLALDQRFQHKEASADLAMVAHCITQHRFSVADSFYQRARALGLRPYEVYSNSFDVDFELGRYTTAAVELRAMQRPDDFGYYFRKSKMDHLNGDLESSIRDMGRAVDLAGTNAYLKDVALANGGDLYVHAENLKAASEAYVQCLHLNSADYHSLMGLGWIALVKDGDDSLATSIFRWVASKTPAPDAWFKLAQVGGDSARQYGLQFVARASQPVYGRMYHKYLIQLYTGMLHQPALAEAMALDELNNRATPQTYAWYAWALTSNGKKDSAYKVFSAHVSGQPLEGLELYWMGKLMEDQNKNYNALAFFKAAMKTRYDLDPADVRYMRSILEE